ncbi:MAG: 23S rRNA (uracil(1939)-C(5))-methyltransferase RlmD [Lachnospiraceae bacterium]|nr:23S rRNA (uracil(1939)-C(5))-methyltransferase RlmD [Lachnospiraceae bacterium]
MKKGQIIEGVITEYAFPNKGSMIVDEADSKTDSMMQASVTDDTARSEHGTSKRRIIVKGAFPGQRIRCQITKLRKGKAEGSLLEVIAKSPLEDTEPKCPHFGGGFFHAEGNLPADFCDKGSCGGCTYQTMSYPNQLKLKEGLVRQLLDGVAADYIWEGILGSPVTEGYRNKMEFSFGDEYKGGPLALGLHKKGSFYDIVNVTDCCIVTRDVNEIVKYTRQFFDERHVPFYHKLRHEGVLRHLVVRQAARSGELLVNLVAASGDLQSLELDVYRDGLLKLPLQGSIVGILFTKNDSMADVVQSDGMQVLYGQDYFMETVLGLRFKITPFSFFQTNTLSAEVLYQKVRDYVGEIAGATVFDLYSGTGTIAQLMASVAKKVIGVDLVDHPIINARENALANGLTNCEFIAGDVLKVLDTLEDKPDMIVLDPPRDGIHPKALKKIINYGVEHIVYVSCKPTSLARDLEVFLENGYRVERACAVDQFVGTVHVETVCLLSKLHAD